MIIHILSKQYGIIMDRKTRKSDKGEIGFQIYDSTVDHLLTLRTTVEECPNNKTNINCFFVYFIKTFDTISRINL